jgi:4-hydroxy-2-oxoheptanedioate aldolase
MLMTRTLLRETLKAGGPVIGVWAMVPSSLTAEAAARSGPGYVVIDQQHGAVSPEAMASMLQAIELGGVPSLVRVARNEAHTIGSALDLGADGVIVPMVEDGEQAAAAVAACRYAQEGSRSFGALRAQDGEALCLVMVETRAAVERVEEIAATPGLDGIYIGPSDLALTYGLQPTIRLEHPPVLEALERVRAACEDAGLIAGLHCLAAEDAALYSDKFAMLTAATDSMVLQAGLAGALATARG